MEEYTILINIINKEIINNNDQELNVNLQRLPLEQLNQITLDRLLSIFINKCVEYASKESLKTIFKVFYDLIPIEYGQLDHLTRIFTYGTLNNEAFYFVITTMNKPIDYYFQHLIDWDLDSIIMVAAKNIAFTYKYVHNSTWRFLYNIAYDSVYPNDFMLEFLSAKVKEDSPIVLQPYWIINEYLPIIPTYTEIQEPIILDNILTNTLTDEVRNLMDDDMYNVYMNANEEEQLTIIKPYLLYINKELIKVYGPSNTLFNVNLNGENICSTIGCRMLTCNEFHEDDDIYDEDYFENTQDWFTGSCEYCLNTIEHRHYACRFPPKNGGWLGCYCSWDCVRYDTKSTKYVELELMDIFENQLLDVGIQDRVYDKNIIDL